MAGEIFWGQRRFELVYCLLFGFALFSFGCFVRWKLVLNKRYIAFVNSVRQFMKQCSLLKKLQVVAGIGTKLFWVEVVEEWYESGAVC